MTATTLSDATAHVTHAAPRRSPTANPAVAGMGTLLQRWSAARRRRRRYLAASQRFDARDRSDRYLDDTDDAHLRQALVGFVQR